MVKAVVKKKEARLRVALDESIIKCLARDGRHFEKVIGKVGSGVGGEWTVNDTLHEWIKILNGVKREAKVAGRKVEVKHK